MICQSCGNEMKLVKAGVSKKTGKPYPAFYSCECGNTYNPPEVAEPIIQAHEEKKANGSPEMMRLAYRKDLMVALVNKYGDTVDTKGLKDMHDDLWLKIEEK